MLWIPLDRTSGHPLIQQIVNQLHTLILTGQLPAGSRLPSSRTLAAELGVSRSVVLEAYDRLLAEGYIETRQGSGTYVCEGACLGEDPSSLPAVDTIADTETGSPGMIDFRPGVPDLRSFPRQVWGRLARMASVDTLWNVFDYAPPEGIPDLRRALADYLGRTRGVRCRPEQVIVTTGATQALSLAIRLLVTPGAPVLFEDPSPREIRMMLEDARASLVPIPVDESGMQTEAIPANANTRMIYLTPSHQFPLGGILPVSRRIQLVRLARDWDSYIVEDDYDSEFRYRGAPVASLQSLDPERVIYVGSCSKILSPGIRLGYAVVPPDLLDPFRKAKRLTDLHTPALEQMVLARFLKEGHLERHVMRMRKLYRKRRDRLAACLREAFGPAIQLSGDATGLHLVATFANTVLDDDLRTRLKESGVVVYPVEEHAMDKGPHRQRMVLGYGNLTEEEIAEGVTRLKTQIWSRAAT